MLRVMFFKVIGMEKYSVEKEIRFRSASNMQNVWNQLEFGKSMDNDEDCSKEADAFVGELADLIWKHVTTGNIMKADIIEDMMLNHPMPSTAKKVAEYRGQEANSGLISQAIVKILDGCHLIEEKDYGKDRLYVEDIVGWWFGKLGIICSKDGKFKSEEFLNWMVIGTSLYFLLNYRAEVELLKKYVSGWEIKPEEILRMSTDYRREEIVESYLIHYKETSDQDMASSARNIMQNEACLIYHDKLWHVTRMLAVTQMFDELADLFARVDLPVLQAAMLSEITEVDDLLCFLERLIERDINHPLTSFSLVREYLYELCGRTSANLLSYQEEYYGLELKNGLGEKWKEVNDAWTNELPNCLLRGLLLLKKRLDSKSIAGWAFAKQYIMPPRKNATSDGYNMCTRVLKEQVLKAYQPQELPVTTGDLQYLFYIGSVYLSADEKPIVDKFNNLLNAIAETVKTNKLLPVSSIDEKLIEDCDIAARILCECFPNRADIFDWFDRYKTWYEGWNVLAGDKLYDNCHKEGRLLCWLLMVASLDVFNEGEREIYWNKLMITLFGQLRSASGYFKSEYVSVLTLAGMVAVQVYNEGLETFLVNCNQYVINIDELIVIMNNSGVTRFLTDNKGLREEKKVILKTITKRFDAEWPLKVKRLRMEGLQAKESVKELEAVVNEWDKMTK